MTDVPGSYLLSNPIFHLALFIGASYLMIWRLEVLSDKGVEGTVLGTLIMPYCSGLGNLIFVFIIIGRRGPGEEVMTNSIVNNVTNLTLLLGLPALIFGLRMLPKKKRGRKPDDGPRIQKLSLLLTLAAAMFFTGAMWALGRDGELNFGDGLVLVGLFLFWQCFHIFEVLKSDKSRKKWLRPGLALDLGLLGIGAYGIYISIDWLVAWISNIETGFISVQYLGWLSGWLMVVPNALLAFYYAWRGRTEVTYTSQVGDGHICIPLCIGMFALFQPLPVPEFFDVSVLILLAAALVHFLFVALMGGLPRWMGAVFVAAYGFFLYRGLAN